MMNRRDYLKYTTSLMGYTIGGSTLVSIVQACSSPPQNSSTFFTPVEYDLVHEIAGTILPESDTPGALSMKVPQFIEMLCLQVFTKEDGNTIKKGLIEFEEACKKRYNRAFSDLDKNVKEAHLIELDKESDHFPISMWGINLEPNPKPITFYRKFKSMVLQGYFTSEKIGKEILVYKPVPGQFVGCIEYNGEKLYGE
jgi:hypothetical protein